MKKLMATGLCIGLLHMPCLTLAQAVSQSPSTRYAAADIAAFHGSQNTLTNAIHDIQQSTGGKVVEIRFAQHNAQPGFHTVVAKGGQVEFARFDQASRSVTQIETRPDWMLKWEQRTDVRLAKNPAVSLAQAIQTAEASKNAPAIAAGIARSASDPDSDVHAYNVLIDAAGSVSRVAVDSATGEIIANPGSLEGWP
jgi:uncharacterized membrane protein YkoI